MALPVRSMRKMTTCQTLPPRRLGASRTPQPTEPTVLVPAELLRRPVPLRPAEGGSASAQRMIQMTASCHRQNHRE